MVTDSDIVTVPINHVSLLRAKQHALACSIGGTSQVRGGDRQKELFVDQVVGQLGNLAGSLWLYGSDTYYEEARQQANLNPLLGDGGSDILGDCVDFKASLLRTSLPLLKHRLAVRPRERHTDYRYVLCLVAADFSCVHLVGWADEHELPSAPESKGVFSGAFVLFANALKAIPEVAGAWASRVK